MIAFPKLISITRYFQALPVPLDVLQTNGTAADRPPTLFVKKTLFLSQ
jgi:hypothetical protein